MTAAGYRSVEVFDAEMSALLAPALAMRLADLLACPPPALRAASPEGELSRSDRGGYAASPRVRAAGS